MNEEMPTTVLLVSISLIIFGVGTFAFYIVYNEIGYETTQTDTFTITNPAVDQTLDLSYIATSITLVEHYNGFEWKTIPAVGYDYSSYQLVVDSEYLEG